MSLSILILNTDYGEFLNWFYGQRAELQCASYSEQLEARMMSRFGVADFYSSNLRRLGHEVWDVHANNAFMQHAWARENGLPIDAPDRKERPLQPILQWCKRGVAKTPLRHLKSYCRPLLGSNSSEPEWFYKILAAQIKQYRPDVLLNQAMDGISNRFLSDIKPHVKLLVGQHAAPLPSNKEFSAYDLVLSSLPNFVGYFRKIGLPAALHRLAFEPRLLDDLENGGQQISVCFAGSLSTHHNSRLALLEYLCARGEDVKVWGPHPYDLPGNSSIRRSYMGQLWGREMYQTLYHSKITLNHHIGVAAAYANNMRLFESTGVGTLLLTDWKQNLSEMFEPGKEVVAYRTAEECLELIEYYLAHEEARASIARNGQRRTLREHNYRDRMGELVEIVREYI